MNLDKISSAKISLTFRNVSLDLRREKRRLVEDFSYTLLPGDRTILTGESGSGKSTLIRCARNVWPDWVGDVDIPGDKNVLCISQKTYIPRTNIVGILSCPYAEGSFDEKDMDAALSDVGLGKLRPFLAVNQMEIKNLTRILASYTRIGMDYYRNRIMFLDQTAQRDLLEKISGFIVDNLDGRLHNRHKKYLDSGKLESIKIQLYTNLLEDIQRYAHQPSAFNLPDFFQS